MTDPRPRCEACRFWKESSRRKGFCHRYPPFPGKGHALWPVTLADDWCGEFQARPHPVFEQPIDSLMLSVRATNCLKENAEPPITTIGELVQKTPWELLDIRDFGNTTLEEICTRLSELGLSLKSDSPGPENATPRRKGIGK